jgi:hypothetical protein
MAKRAEVLSPYMEYAKLHSSAKYTLASSGVMAYPLSELNAHIEDLEINGPSTNGYPPLQQRIADYCGVDPDCVIHSIGTSMANYVALVSLLEEGDEVLMEQPTYEVLLNALRFTGANVKRFLRPRENGWRIDLREIERNISPRTRLIIVCNLHNPTGAYIDEQTVRGIGELARSVGARVLVDEVYMEAMFDKRPRTAALLGPEFVVTSSLTKAFGLSGLRCGWVLAEPRLVRRMWQVIDLLYGIPAHPAELLSVIAFDQLPRIAKRARKLIETNRSALLDFIRRRDDLDTVVPEYGTIIFPRLKRGSMDDFSELLREKCETSVVPGRFFEEPQHCRIGMGGDPEVMRAGLEQMGKALDEYAASLR